MSNLIDAAEKEVKRSDRLFTKYYHDSTCVRHWSAENYAKLTKMMPKVGRNELCKCGSGKKYKNCCGK